MASIWAWFYRQEWLPAKHLILRIDLRDNSTEVYMHIKK